MFQAVSLVVGTSLMVLLIDIFTALGTPRPQAIFAVSLVRVAYLVSRAMLVAIGERLLSVTLAAAVLVAMPLSLAPLLLWPLSSAPLPAWVAAATAVAYGLPAEVLDIPAPDHFRTDHRQAKLRPRAGSAVQAWRLRGVAGGLRLGRRGPLPD